MIRNPRILRAISLFLLIQFVTQLFFPGVSFALTSGPSQPEFSSFEPVSSTNMVDEFSGDFTYNLPLLEVPGPHGSSYPFSLSYHSGATPEEEASWVGFGWTLNPGAINRNTRGLPDDYKGKDVTFHNKRPKNWTGTVGGSAAMEIFGKDLGAQLSASTSIRYNNYRGFGYNAGIGVSMGKGLLSMGYNVSDGEGHFSLDVNPYKILYFNQSHKKKIAADVNRYLDKGYWKGFKDRKRTSVGQSTNLIGSSYGMFSYTETSKPAIVQGYTGKAFNVSVGLQLNPGPVPVGVTENVFGSYTFQENIESQVTKGYGFMYSSEATDDDLMDYHVENENDFDKRDVFLGVPFTDSDNFMVTGEGIGGGFRMHNKTAGHFNPRKMTSTMDIYNVGGEIGLGWTFGPGADVGVGSHSLDVAKWSNLSTFKSLDDPATDEPVFFRFNNDLGGEWGDNHNDAPVRAQLSGENISIPATLQDYSTAAQRSGRSSYVGFNRNKDIASGITPLYKSYSKNVKINSYSSRSAADRLDLVGEFAVFNESGNMYVYGLPVYAKNEKSLSFSARGTAPAVNGFIAYTGAPNSEIKLGEEKNSPYATTFLLTEITTPDYIDAGSSGGERGPSDDDLGGYTKFNYERKSTDYTWRSPYKGLIYNRNSQSDAMDDLVSYSEGQKEIYYLHTIETKTHVAFFTVSVRKDGKSAGANAFDSNAQQGSATSYKLDRIDLYAIEDCKRLNGILDREAWGSPKLRTDVTPVPLKTVRFVYDYSLMQGLPNSSDGTGKLTLKNVYFEYNGVSRTRISPYEFRYAYPQASAGGGKTSYEDYPPKYRLEKPEENVTLNYIGIDASNQNPSYSQFLNDSWGFYQKEGDVRFAHQRSWVNQAPPAGFDPAAWQLKVIRLPSGGELHVQYEQDDYSYVQDQEAHVMAEVLAVSGDNQFTLKGSSIGISNTTEADIARDMILRRYVSGQNKMYFKILYGLIGSTEPTLSTCNAEHITGYVSIKNCVSTGTDLVITLEPEQRYLPKQVCIDFVKSQRLGKVDPTGNCNPATGVSDPNDAKGLVMQLLSLATGVALPSVMCAAIDESHSYFRIPTPLAKKGGGLRVKRLMMFDKGLDNETVLYGNEYVYLTQDGNRVISSGVATNEPQAAREENILVDFIAKKKFAGKKLLAGKDKEKAEGPLGESILPGSSVGYSKVVVKNIHTGKTNPGFSVSEFFTAREYPVMLGDPENRTTMTDILKVEKNPVPLTLPFYNKVEKSTSATQGFSFVLNNMHGQVKRKASYSGDYAEIFNPAKSKVITETIYEYFKPGEKVPVMSSLYGQTELKNPGREVELTFANRKVTELSKDVNVEGDLQITIIPLLFIVLVIPYPTAIPAFSNVEGELKTHATTKVVRYPAILKKVTTTQEGIKHFEEYLAFDSNTGKPVSIKSNDEYRGAYLTQNIPASWEYKAMGGIYKSQNKIIQGNFTFANRTINLGTDACSIEEFTPGDMIEFGDPANPSTYYVTTIDRAGNNLNLEHINNAYAGPAFNRINIIHSGRTNQLNEEAGSIVTHEENEKDARPVIVDQASRYETISFGDALKAATQNLSGIGTFNLNGKYCNMDMSAFANLLTSCSIDLTNATVRNLEYQYKVENNQVYADLLSFDILCLDNAACTSTPAETNWKTIAADGWE
jgi:hypothetical protein